MEGVFELKGQPENEGAAVEIDRYELRVVHAWREEYDNELHLDRTSTPFLTGEAVAHLTEITADLHQCPVCGHWYRGAGPCEQCFTLECLSCGSKFQSVDPDACECPTCAEVYREEMTAKWEELARQREVQYA